MLISTIGYSQNFPLFYSRYFDLYDKKYYDEYCCLNKVGENKKQCLVLSTEYEKSYSYFILKHEKHGKYDYYLTRDNYTKKICYIRIYMNHAIIETEYDVVNCYMVLEGRFD